MERANPIRVKCHHCGYEWWTRSTMKYVTCPRCYYRVKNPRYGDKK